MKQLFLLVLLSSTFTLQVLAQEQETFASLDKVNGVTNIIKVTHNENGSVTITRSQRALEPTDQLRVINRAGDATSFWLVSFDGKIVQKIENDIPTVECKCDKVKPDCAEKTVCAKTYRFGEGIFVCKIEGCYDDFKMFVSDTLNTGGMLYVKATNVVIED